MKQAELFLHKMLCIMEGVFEFVTSQTFCQDHKLMTLFFSSMQVIICCTLHTAHFTLTMCTFLHSLLMFLLLLLYLVYDFYNNTI